MFRTPASWRIQVNAPVFYPSAVILALFVLYATLLAEDAQRVFAAIQAFVIADFGWFYIATVAGFLVFCLFLMFSRYGDVKLGADDSEPEYSYLSWFSMLFSAGMGIGLLFFGVAEPMQHYIQPPLGEGQTVEAARGAMVLTFFHWGLHAWAIYVVVGLALAYFAFRRGLPLTIRSALYPLIGKRIYGPIGHTVGVFAVVGTMFGVATSLGFGVLQVNAGFAHLFGLPIGPGVQLILIAVITAMATASVALGMDKGVKRLSELNIILAIALLIFVLFAGSTVFLLQAYMQNIGAYLSDAVERTFRMYAYNPNPWLGNWTLFYWGWWMAWSPFVGMFIARISRGRTIREFVSGVLLVPSAFTFLWMTVFGNTAISLDMSGVADIAGAVANDMPTALFQVLEQLPFSTVSCGLATALIVTFFVTSADSGALVIDTITSGGEEASPAWQRVFWAVGAGVLAAVLLVAGGLQALQTAAIASALPFAVVMVFMCYGLLRALQTEGRAAAVDLSKAPDLASEHLGLRWQQRLHGILHLHRRQEVDGLLAGTVRPALDAVAAQMRDSGLQASVTEEDGRVEFALTHGDGSAFRYAVRRRSFRSANFAWAQRKATTEAEQRHYRAIVSSTDSDRSHDVTAYSLQQVIDDLLGRYARFHHAQRQL